MDFSKTNIDKVIVHQVGNKLREEGVYLSNSKLLIDSKLEQGLLNYCLKPFIDESGGYCFRHTSSLNFNEVYTYVQNIFTLSDFEEESRKIASHLYEFSLHPRVVMGELLIVKFKNIKYEDKFVDAIGIYKVEKKDLYLKVLKSQNNLSLETDEGISINKVEKGCLILNIDSISGYKVFNIDIHQKVTDYWVNKFLSIELIENDSYKTKQFIHLCKAFSDDILSNKYEKHQQLEFSNNILEYFESRTTYNYDDFLTATIADEKIKNEFIEFQNTYKNNFLINFDDEFDISKEDVKREKRKIKNIIKLDTNVEVKFLIDKHFDESSFEKGYDNDRGMYFYKFYFNEES